MENYQKPFHLIHEEVGLEIKGAAAEGRSRGETSWEGGEWEGGDEEEGGDDGRGEGAGDRQGGGGGEEEDEEEAGRK